MAYLGGLTKFGTARIRFRYLRTVVLLNADSSPVPYSMYYKPMMYYKHTPSSAQSSCIGIGLGNSHYKLTPLFRVDVRKIAHELIIRTIRYSYMNIDGLPLYQAHKVTCGQPATGKQEVTMCLSDVNIITQDQPGRPAFQDLIGRHAREHRTHVHITVTSKS